MGGRQAEPGSGAGSPALLPDLYLQPCLASLHPNRFPDGFPIPPWQRCPGRHLRACKMLVLAKHFPEGMQKPAPCGC